MILRVPNFPPLNNAGKPPRPLILLLGQGGWQDRVAADISRSRGCIVCTDGVLQDQKALPGQWIQVVMEYLEAVDVIGVWSGASGLYLDEWTLAAYFLGRRPGIVVCGSFPDADHPMAPGLVYLAQRAGAAVYSRSELFIAAIRERARTIQRAD